MNLAEQVYQIVKPMPESMAQEVLDFVLFLRQREESREWRDLMLAQAHSLTDWDNAEDEVWNDVPAR
jgi:nitrous oxide reductase accessory protein NosL